MRILNYSRAFWDKARIKGLSKTLATALLSLATLTTLSLFSKLLVQVPINGFCVAKVMGTDQCMPPSSGNWWLLLITATIFITCTHITLNYLKRLAPIHIFRGRTKLQPKRALVLMVSPMPHRLEAEPEWKLTANFGDKKGQSIILKADNVTDAINELNLGNSPAQVNWQQLLRAIQPHLKTLERVVLVASDDYQFQNQAGDYTKLQGSKQQLPLCQAWLQHLLSPKITITTAVSAPLQIRDLYQTLTDIGKELKKDGFSEKDISFDATGGLATMSIAAALATLHSESTFQYVEPQVTRKDGNAVFCYDSTIGSRES